MKKKFRAWDKQCNWLTNVVCLNLGTWKDIVLIDPRGHNNQTYSQSTENVVIQQYIGQKDSEGREVYEGDILEDWYNEDYSSYKVTGQVAWSDGHCGFIVIDTKENAHLFIEELIKGKVIGNIFENPELLKL